MLLEDAKTRPYFDKPVSYTIKVAKAYADRLLFSSTRFLSTRFLFGILVDESKHENIENLDFFIAEFENVAISQ